MAGDTGNGMTLTLAPTAFTAEIQSIQLPEWAFDMIDKSHLGSSEFMEMIPGDLKTPGEAVMTILTGSGSIRVFGFPEAANQTLMVANVTFAFDGIPVTSGGVPPAFTPEAAPPP